MKTFRIDGIKWLQQFVDPEDEVLDLGCGLMQTTRNLKCKAIFGIDAYKPYIEELRQTGFKYVYHGRAEKYINDFLENSFDVVMAIDFIEHLTKDAALKLILRMEYVAKKRTIIFTPDGFVKNTRAENTKLQKHRCGFRPADLSAFGYEVYYREGGDVPSFLAVKELNNG